MLPIADMLSNTEAATSWRMGR